MNFTIGLTLVILLIIAGFLIMGWLIHSIGLKINGRMTQMMHSVKELAHKEGMEEERLHPQK